jgi:hypothetical protein
VTMTTTASPGPAPGPPGSLTVPPDAPDVLAYLEAFGRWVTALRAALDALDAAAQAAKAPERYSADVALAMSLWSSIDARHHELVTAWDSGRVGRDELARLATLLWGRLPDPFGNPSAFTLPEACTLAAALLERVQGALATDAVAGSGAAGRVAPVRAAIERCRAQAAVLSVPTDRIDALASELEAALGASDQQVIATVVARVDAEITAIERDLIKDAGNRATVASRIAALGRRRIDLAAQERTVRELADRCRAKIAGAPRLAVPSIAALGELPEPPSGPAPTVWSAAREQVETYESRLDRCADALAEAERAFEAPLAERDDLRGLLGAYRDRAARHGLAEDLALSDRYEAAHDVLWSAPCDLSAARARVGEYQSAVRRAVGADPAEEQR